MNKNKTTKTTYVRDLRAGERFTIAPHSTEYVADKVTTMGNMTRVDYHIGSDHAINRFSFAKVNLSTVTVLD